LAEQALEKARQEKASQERIEELKRKAQKEAEEARLAKEVADRER
jgi:hypothetical protein